MSAQHVVVIGAGISGLSAALRLVDEGPPGLRVTVVESAARVGGKLHTADFAGLRVEHGADAFLARVPEVPALAARVGLTDSLTSPATSSASIWVGGRMRPLPAGTVLGVPTSARAALRARVLSPRARLRAAAEPWLPGRPLTRDATVGDVVGARLGRQVVDRLVEPLLGGVFAGRADVLGVDAALPRVAAAARSGRSLLRGLGASTDAPTADPAAPVFLGIEGGLGRLAEACAAALLAAGSEVLLGTRVAALDRVGRGWRVTLAGGRAIVADGVVIALPPAPTAQLLRASAPGAAVALGEIRSASVALVLLAYGIADVAGLPRGSGFLVPGSEGRTVKALTHASAKWAWLADPQTAVVRASAGRDGEPAPEDDDALVTAVLADLRAAGLRHEPREHRVVRWLDALPQYEVGHATRIARVQEELAARAPALAVAGAAYEGVGLPACVRVASGAADRVLHDLARVRDRTVAGARQERDAAP